MKFTLAFLVLILALTTYHEYINALITRKKEKKKTQIVIEKGNCNELV